MQSNEEILEKAIQKAIDGGWKPIVAGEVTGLGSNQFTGELHLAHDAPWNNDKWALGQSVASVLIDPDFAKALWGEEVNYDGWLEPMWQHHLQAMVIADDPIKYLGENI